MKLWPLDALQFCMLYAWSKSPTKISWKVMLWWKSLRLSCIFNRRSIHVMHEPCLIVTLVSQISAVKLSRSLWLFFYQNGPIIPDSCCYLSLSVYCHENRFFNYTLSITNIPFHLLIGLSFISCVISPNFMRYILHDD